MATASVNIGTSGYNSSGGSGTVLAGATNKKYTVTAASISWGSGYLQLGDTVQEQTVVLKINGTQVASVWCRHGVSNVRPTISWTGTKALGANTSITYDWTCKWWGIITLNVTYTEVTAPTVAVGDDITKTNMDNLKTFLGTGNTVTVETQINASDGTTYKTVTAGDSITASWYNT